MRVILYALLFVVFVGAGYFGFAKYKEFSSGEAFGTAFQLVDQKGQPISERDFRAQPSAVFFGFTHCPEICPTTLFELDGWLKQLGPEGEDIRGFFVSVDPERDTPEILDQYISNVSSRITGVTGDPEKVAAMAKGFHIYSKKVPLEGDDYTMDHTASVLLIAKGGGFAGTIAYGESPDTALAKLKRLASGG